MHRLQAHHIHKPYCFVAALALVLSAWAGFAPTVQGQSSKAGTDTNAPAQTAAKVNVNSADAKALATLPGVGPTIAQRIIDGRPYHSLADLEKVNGLSHAKVQALKGKVSFTQAKAKRQKPSEASTTVQDSSTATSAPKPTSPASAASASARQNVSSSDASSSVSPSSSTAGQSGSSKLAPGEKININTASAEELDRLPGIGKAKAKAIIDYRTQNGDFKSLEDIQKVKGIKTGEFGKLKDYIKLSD